MFPTNNFYTDPNMANDLCSAPVYSSDLCLLYPVLTYIFYNFWKFSTRYELRGDLQKDPLDLNFTQACGFYMEPKNVSPGRP